MCRVIDAFVEELVTQKLGFVVLVLEYSNRVAIRTEAAELLSDDVAKPTFWNRALDRSDSPKILDSLKVITGPTIMC
jgi:hypothetical protein